MSSQQAENFIAILRTACGNGQKKLCNPNWDELIKTARSQMLTALFYTGAIQYNEFATCPAEQREMLQRQTIAVVGQQARRTQLFLQLYRSLLDAGLKPLVLKGIVCRSLYGDLADYRPSVDEDFYIPPDQVEVCRQVLDRNGWALTSHEESLDIKEKVPEIIFDDKDRLLHLELHPSLFKEEGQRLERYTQYFQDVEKRAVTVTIEGQPVYTLGITDHYLYLFLHLAKHFSGNGVGIRQIMDLMVFACAYDDQIDWEKVRRVVAELSSPELYADVVAIGHKLGFQADPLFPPLQPDRLLSDSMAGGIYGNDREGDGHGTIWTIAARYPTYWKRVQRFLFPSLHQLVAGRPWLEKRPWLLPVAWGQRAGRVIIIKRLQGKVTWKSLQVAHQRNQLLRSYGLLPERKSSKGRRQKK